eukprot:791173-Prorocentrum_lima.AAC.1
MTSSLVGSEMCIRDSNMLLFGVDVCGARCCKMSLASVREATWDTCFDTVSYTHLTLPTICSV